MAEISEVTNPGIITLPEIAGPQHSEELNAFYEQFTLKGPLEFRPHRPQNFFSPYELHSKDYETFILRGDNGEIQACASFLYRDVLIEGTI